jgi:hypothetical protein
MRAADLLVGEKTGDLEARRTKRRRAMILTLIVLVGFFAATAYHYAQALYDRQAYPKDTFLFLPSVHFSDFYDVVRDGSSPIPYLQAKSAQYPLLLTVGFVFGLVPKAYSSWIYLLLFAGTFAALSAAFLRLGEWSETAVCAFTLVFLSYPFLFTVDRANFEGLTFILVIAFALCFAKKRYLLAAIFLAVASALKLFPIVLVLLFFPEKQYRAMALCILLTGILTLGSLLTLGGGFQANLRFLLLGSNIAANRLFAAFTSIRSPMIQRGVSVFTLLKIVRFETNVMQGIPTDNFSSVYWLFAGLTGTAMAAYAVFIEKTLWKRAAVLMFAIILLPTISADYKLLFVFVPLFLFLDNPGGTSKWDTLYLLLFGVLLIPKSYYYFQNVFSDASKAHDITISVVINILVLITMSLLIIATGTRVWILGLWKQRGATTAPAEAPGQPPSTSADPNEGRIC